MEENMQFFNFRKIDMYDILSLVFKKANFETYVSDKFQSSGEYNPNLKKLLVNNIYLIQMAARVLENSGLLGPNTVIENS